MKKFIITFLFISCAVISHAQIQTPVRWSYAAKQTSSTEAYLLIKATIDDGWHIYSTVQPAGGPVKTTIKFTPSKAYIKVGKITEPKPHATFEKTFDINVLTFEKEVIFQQKIKLKTPHAEKDFTVKGSLEYMVCNDHQCLPPETVEFTVPVK